MQDCPQPAPGVFVGVDVAKGNHYACALTSGGDALFSRPGSQRRGGYPSDDRRRSSSWQPGAGG